MAGLELVSVVWARLGSAAWWPATVSHDPSGSWERVRGTGRQEFHVTFLGEATRAWITASNIKPFLGGAAHETEREEELAAASSKKGGRGRVQRSYLPTPGTAATWAAALAGAEQLLLQPDPQARAAEAETLSAEIAVSLRKERKRKLSWEQPVLKAGVEEGKRRRLEPEAKEDSEKDAGKEDTDITEVTAGGTSRQRDLAVSKQEKERQKKEKGPGWWVQVSQRIAKLHAYMFQVLRVGAGADQARRRTGVDGPTGRKLHPAGPRVCGVRAGRPRPGPALPRSLWTGVVQQSQPFKRDNPSYLFYIICYRVRV